jgi:hypothetical protein
VSLLAAKPLLSVPVVRKALLRRGGIAGEIAGFPAKLWKATASYADLVGSWVHAALVAVLSMVGCLPFVAAHQFIPRRNDTRSGRRPKVRRLRALGSGTLLFLPVALLAGVWLESQRVVRPAAWQPTWPRSFLPAFVIAAGVLKCFWMSEVVHRRLPVPPMADRRTGDLLIDILRQGFGGSHTPPHSGQVIRSPMRGISARS